MLAPLLASLPFALLGAPAARADIPLVAIGLPFAPEAPHPVASDHPLYHRVQVGEIVDLPGMIRFSAAPPGRVHKALRETLEQMNLLAPTDADAKVKLVATWGGLDSPAKFLMPGTQTSATLSYRLSRLDNGQILMDRTITTTLAGKGSAYDGGMGMARGAIAANFASAAMCMDKAAYGHAPQDCALQPLYGVSVERR